VPRIESLAAFPSWITPLFQVRLLVVSVAEFHFRYTSWVNDNIFGAAIEGC
jgi:hypothetical protein